MLNCRGNEVACDAVVFEKVRKRPMWRLFGENISDGCIYLVDDGKRCGGVGGQTQVCNLLARLLGPLSYRQTRRV